MRAHIIENGIVINTINIEALDTVPELTSKLIDAEQGGKVGDLWDGSTFTTPAKPIIEPAATFAQPTKEELLTELQTLTAKINALE
jgi:hypothetical protein